MSVEWTLVHEAGTERAGFGVELHITLNPKGRILGQQSTHV